MKILLLTTQTYHHTWFLKQIMKVFPNIKCIVETPNQRSSKQMTNDDVLEFETDRYDLEHLLAGQKASVFDLSETLSVEDINAPEAVSFIKKYHPDLAIVFGTRKIKNGILSLLKDRIINLHGGDPECYRGLDSHLWAIYHQDFSAIVTSLHYVDSTLDTGDLILKHKLDLNEIEALYQLRSLNTKACVKLVLSAFHMFEQFGHFLSFPQRKVGRYYSKMPLILKSKCIKYFQEYRNVDKCI